MLDLRNVPHFEWVKERWLEIYHDSSIPLEYKQLLGIVMLTGVRISEALNLKPEDIDIKRRVLRIRQLKKRKVQYREVPIPQTLANVLENFQGFDFSRRYAYHIVKKYTGYNPHSFRHSFAMAILKETRNMEYARRLLGHSNYNTLRHYLDFTIEDIREDVEKVYGYDD